MCDHAPWFVYVMSVTMGLTRAGVSSVEVPESPMPTIVKSAPFRRRIETVAQRLSIWGALKPTCSTNEKNTASRRGDGWAPPSFRIKLLQLPEKTPTTTSRDRSPVSPEQPPRASVLTPDPCLSSPCR